jgi:hypothetical protein
MSILTARLRILRFKKAANTTLNPSAVVTAYFLTCTSVAKTLKRSDMLVLGIK